MDKVAIKYVGKRDTYVEGTYGSRIQFTQGQSVLVPSGLAAKLLRHADQYAKGEVEVAEVVPVDKPDTEPDKTQDMRDQIAVMDKSALESFAKTAFRIDLDKRKGLESLRQQVIGLVDQFGVQ